METWLYLPNGCKVKFEFTESSMPEDDYANALNYTNRVIALGANVNAPGLEAGEEKDEIGQIAHWLKDDNDGGQSHRVDLFVNHPQMVSRLMSVYVKHIPEELAAFKNITGIDLSTAKMLPTLAPIQDKSKDKNGYVISLPHPVIAVWKHNPHYDESKKMEDGKPKRLFVRWESVGTPTVKPPAPSVVQNTGANDLTAISTPQTAQNAGKGVFKHELQDIWNVPPSGAHWTRLKQWLLHNVYDNKRIALDRSFAKRAKETNNWKRDDDSQMTVGDIVTFLQTRHAGEEQGLQEAS